MRDMERGKISADHLHHAGVRSRTYLRQPNTFRLIEKRAAVFGRQCLTDRLEIIARIKSLGKS